MVYSTSAIALATLLFCTSSLAVPLEGKRFTSIPLTRHAAPNVTARDYAEADRLRHRSLATRGLANAPVANSVDKYTMTIQVGNQTFLLGVDTGSSNLVIGNNKAYVPTSSAVDTGNAFAIYYECCSSIGELWTDSVVVGGLPINAQGLGVTSLGYSTLPAYLDGFIGFGPVGLTYGTAANTYEVTTVMQNLKDQGMISENVLGIFFHAEPGSSSHDVNGELTLGGVDKSKFTGNILYAPLTTAPLFNEFFGIDFSSISYGSTVIMTSSHPAIFDTGTRMPVIPGAVFDAMIAAAGGGGVIYGSAYFNSMPTQNISFNFNGHTISLTPSQYVIPTAQAVGDLGLSAGVIWSYLQRGDDDVDGSPSLNFVIGMKFLEFVYSVYDVDNQRVGMAPNAY